MAMKSSQTNSYLFSKVSYHESAEDTRSTSASGSDTETDKLQGLFQLTSGEEDNQVFTSDSESEAQPVDMRDAEEPKDLIQKQTEDKTPATGAAKSWVNSAKGPVVAVVVAVVLAEFASVWLDVLVMVLIGLLRWRYARRVPKTTPQCSAPQYSRNMLLQLRPLPDSQIKQSSMVPQTKHVQCIRQIQASATVSAESSELSGPPGIELPPGLGLPPRFEPPPGMHAPLGAKWSELKGHKNASKGMCKTGASHHAQQRPQPNAAREATKRRQSTKSGANTQPANHVEKEMQSAVLMKPTVPKRVVSEVSPPAAVPKVFTAVAFRKELTVILRDLSSDWNVGAAVQRVRDQCVPQEHQAAQVVDIVTRAAEERRGVIRRLSFAFIAGLAKADPSAFDKAECLAGLRTFFDEVYTDLLDEVPRLRVIIANEFLPTLQSVFAAKELSEILPVELRMA